jgi:site-specific recombinase XerD
METAQAIAQVIQFPGVLAGQRSEKRRTPVSTDTIKYFSEPEIKAIRKAAREHSEADDSKGRVTGVRAWMIIDLLTCTGLRVSEAANLKVGDLKVGYGQHEVHVENGKGNVSGTVVIPPGLATHLRSFLSWKQSQNEGTSPHDRLFIGKRGSMTCQAIQQIVKGYLKRLGLYEKGKSVHSLRHSYAVSLYQEKKDLRAVQKQLRHVSIQSTLVYADVSKEEIYEQVKGMWN